MIEEELSKLQAENAELQAKLSTARHDALMEAVKELDVHAEGLSTKAGKALLSCYGNSLEFAIDICTRMAKEKP